MSPFEAYQKALLAQKRLPRYEPKIITHGFYSLQYARDVIHGRWPEAEPIIIQDAYNAYYYARDVIKARWIEAEQCIIQNAGSSYRYAIDVIKDRWLEAEESIAKTGYSQPYIEHFFDEPVITKEQADIIQWTRNNLTGYFAPASLLEDKVSLLDMVIE